MLDVLSAVGPDGHRYTGSILDEVVCLSCIVSQKRNVCQIVSGTKILNPQFSLVLGTCSFNDSRSKVYFHHVFLADLGVDVRPDGPRMAPALLWQSGLWKALTFKNVSQAAT